MAEHKSDRHPYYGSHRPDSRGADQNSLAVLLKQSAFRLLLAALRLQDQFAMNTPAEVRVGCHRDQDPLQMLGQIEQALHLFVSAQSDG